MFFAENLVLLGAMQELEKNVKAFNSPRGNKDTNCHVHLLLEGPNVHSFAKKHITTGLQAKPCS